MGQNLANRNITHNRPDITLIDKQNKKAYFIDITVPHNSNIQKTQEEKIRKYSELIIERKKQCSVNRKH